MKKNIAKITSIAIISASILSFLPLNADAYSYSSGRVYTNGYTVTRSYGSTYSSPSTTNETTTYKPTYSNYNQNTTVIDTKDTSVNSSTTDIKDSINSSNTYKEYTNSYTSYKTGTSSRYYGPAPQNNSTESNTTSNTNTVSKDKSPTVSNISVNTNNSSSNINQSYVDKMLNLINSERENNGLNPLKLNDKLTSVAQLKADEMAEKNYLSHTSPSYGSIYTMIRNGGISYYNAGENIATAYSVESAHRNFMNSGIHRRAILASHFTHVGIGVSKTSTGMYKISVMFIEER